jgi:glycosyltransferase involved in cell wall biosynthesis
VRILIFHGYLLRGTGSNVYNASLAQALAKLGHEVHLLCQDRDADRLDWAGGSGPGSVTVHVPDIGGLLPVFVADRYEGFEVKTFPELSDEELDRYLDANVSAVRAVVGSAGEPDAALANHLIMGPAILARAGVDFALKVHGSDLSYTVMPHPDRFVPYAREGAEAANGILVGSGHTARDLFETVGDGDLRAKTRLGPPGVDVEHFRPRDPGEARDGLERLAATLEREAGAGDDSFARDGAAGAEALRSWGGADERVLFVGKLLINKGVDLLLAAWPLVHRRRREAGADASLLLAGFGAYRPGVKALIEALGRGDLDAARAVAAAGREYEGGERSSLPILSRFLADPPPGYADAARVAAGSVHLCGRLEHEEVADVMPAAAAFAMPSTFPEAFGMVPAESAACGVPPVSANHSGMREVSTQLAAALPPELAPLLSFEAGDDAVTELAERIGGWLALEPGRRRELGRRLSERVGELWSWERVAAGVIAASGGELDGLPHPTTE